MPKKSFVFHGDRIEVTSYDWSASSVSRNPVLLPSDIASIRPTKWPPELRLKNGETIFCPATYEPELRTFAETHGIPLVWAHDVWGELNEPFVDTEFSDEAKLRTLARLAECGLDAEAVQKIRDRVGNSMLTYNAVLWDWVHLGHDDVLRAQLLLTKDFYNWTMEIARADEATAKAEGPELRTDADRFDSQTYDLLEGYSIERRSEIANDLFRAYSEANRHYHNLAHIFQVLADARSLAPRAELSPEERRSLFMAALYHDVVYDAQAKDNELRSAKKLLEDLGGSDITNRAAELVLFTKSHFQVRDRLDKVMADADLAILGSAPARYDRYAAAVRAEYAHVRDADYRAGRSAFLRKLLEVERSGKLFHFLQPIYRTNSVRNIERELASLS